MRFVNILNAKTAYIYQKNGVPSLVIAKKPKKFSTTTLYVVADSYNPFSGPAEMPGLKNV